MKKIIPLLLCATSFTATAAESADTSINDIQQQFEANCYSIAVLDKTEVNYSTYDRFDRKGDFAFTDIQLEGKNPYDILVMLDLQRKPLRLRIINFYNEIAILKHQYPDGDFSFINDKINIYGASDEELVSVYKDLAGMVINYLVNDIALLNPDATFHVDKRQCPVKTVNFYDHSRFNTIHNIGPIALEKAVNSLIDGGERMFIDNRLAYLEL